MIRYRPPEGHRQRMLACHGEKRYVCAGTPGRTVVLTDGVLLVNMGQEAQNAKTRTTRNQGDRRSTRHNERSQSFGHK